MLEINELLELMVVVWIGGKFFRHLGLPVIFGELVAGLIAGPALFGFVDPDETIRILAELGVFFLMLHAGLESEPGDFLRTWKQVVFIAAGAILLPFVGGYAVSSLFGYGLVEAMFIGMILSVTSVAVAARLFKDYQAENTNIANITVGVALISDILALIMFSVILEIGGSGIDLAVIGMVVLKMALFFGGVLFLGYRFSGQINKVIYSGNKGFTFTLIVALFFGLLAEAMGLHLVLGAFLAGLFIREEVIEDELFAKIEDRIYGISYSFLAPIFFASLAFDIDFAAVREIPIFLVTLIVCSMLFKLVGAGVTSHLIKNKPIESLGLGIAVNSRGAVDLVLTAIGFKMGIIDGQIFSALILLAFTTTFIAIFAMKPVVKRIAND